MSFSSVSSKYITTHSLNGMLPNNKWEQTIYIQPYNHKNESKKNHIEQNRPDTKDYVLYDFLYKKCKNRWNSSMELEVKIVDPLIRGGVVTTRGMRRIMGFWKRCLFGLGGG